jgi:hypothetical protein
MIATKTRKRSVQKSTARRKVGVKRTVNISASYNAVKEYNGKQYTGMAIGRSVMMGYVFPLK